MHVLRLIAVIGVVMHVVTMMVQWPTGPTPRLTIIDGLRDVHRGQSRRRLAQQDGLKDLGYFFFVTKIVCWLRCTLDGETFHQLGIRKIGLLLMLSILLFRGFFEEVVILQL